MATRILRSLAADKTFIVRPAVREFDELADTSSVAQEALQRIARIWRATREFAKMTAVQRLAARERP